MSIELMDFQEFDDIKHFSWWTGFSEEYLNERSVDLMLHTAGHRGGTLTAKNASGEMVGYCTMRVERWGQKSQKTVSYDLSFIPLEDYIKRFVEDKEPRFKIKEFEKGVGQAVEYIEFCLLYNSALKNEIAASTVGNGRFYEDIGS